MDVPPAYCAVPQQPTAPPLSSVAGAPPAKTDIPQARVRLRFECSGLPRLDALSKSDPQVVAFLRNPSAAPSWLATDADCRNSVHQSGRPKEDFYREWTELGRTEWVKDEDNPKFVTAVEMSYYFEEEQRVRFEIFDIDNVGAPLSTQDYIGYVQTTVAAIVSSRGSTLVTRICHPAREANGTLKVTAEEVNEAGQGYVARFCLRADNLPSGLLSTPTAHFVISRAVGSSGDAFHPVFQSQAAAKSTSPRWPPVELPLLTLCNGNLDIPLRVEVWNKHKLIGQAVRTGRDFQSGLVVPLVSQPASGKKCGSLQVVEWDVVKVPTFLEYIRGGANILMTVAIDWTSSNGDPRKPESLHYNCPGRYNEYQQAIVSVGSILEEYDSDKMLPVYGFGGKLPNGTVSHCFALNGNAENPEVSRIDGILAAYSTALNNVALYGPTNFSPIINEVSEQIRLSLAENSSKETVDYYILLMLTDGVITDMENTVRAIVRASSLPLSIVIVGVGNADFENMNVLDGDEVRLKADGLTAERDIVQFVPFRQFKNSHPADLSRAVLAEIPDQFLSYMRGHKVKPRVARANSIASLTSGHAGLSAARSYAPPGGGALKAGY